MPRPRRKWYVGVSVTRDPYSTRRHAFTSADTPTPEAYPAYAYVVGPFRTGRAARLCERVGPHPVLQHVRDFERLARHQEVE